MEESEMKILEIKLLLPDENFVNEYLRYELGGLFSELSISAKNGGLESEILWIDGCAVGVITITEAK